MPIKLSILILSLATLLSGCGGGSSSSAGTTATTSSSAGTTATTSTSAGTTATVTATAKAVQRGQVKDSKTGNRLENVKVSVGESITTTDKNGFYTLSDLIITSEEVVINFEKEGYLFGSTQILLKSVSEDNTVSSNYLEYDMYAHDYQLDYNSSDEIDSEHIDIDASVSYIDTKGNPYSGTMAVKLTIPDNTEDTLLTSFPGAFQGINSNGTLVQFDTYGLISISSEDSNGDKLSLSDDEIITLKFDAVSSLEKPDTLPLWYYDYEQGLWFEEGYAQLQEDGSYKGEVSHFGTWSINRPLEDEAGIYRGRIINEDGSPMSDVRVHAVGENWISSDLTTDENGIFEIEVIPDSSFQLKAYDYKNRYGADYNSTIAAVASGDVVED